MCKVLELNGETEILSFYSVILMFKPHFPAFPFCFGYYLMKFVPRLFLELDIALIFSSDKQFLDQVHMFPVYLCVEHVTEQIVGDFHLSGC